MFGSRVSRSSTALCLVTAAFAWSTTIADDENSKVLGSIHVPSGQHIGDATTVNGSIEIGANAIVKHAETVNGSIKMLEHSSADSLKTVNGSVTLEEGVRVAGDVELVNGRISLQKGADVGGSLTNVNGLIELDGAHVGGGIETTSGDLEIGPGSHVDGGILMNKSGDSWFHFFGGSDPRVVIGPGAVVKGRLRFLRDVKLYVSDHASVGPVEGATASKFAGEQP
jgi:hypothetical protein